MNDTVVRPKPLKIYAALLIILTLWMSLPGIASMQVTDRDEARFAQATVQMVESGDYINIEFQERARNKKPAGIYWMQAVFVKALTDPGERKIWTHRIVSVIGALMAVLATFWGAIAVLGRRGAFVAAAILATSLGFVFEAHIAKTDAILCGLSAVCLACLLRLQKQRGRWTAFIFWVALAAAIMVKGPITPLIIALTLISYAIWTKDRDWLGSIVSLPGIFVAMIMILPWAIAIWVATDGAFFFDSLGGDMGQKMVGGQEGHGAWPGYYLLGISLIFWPGILFLIPGLVFARIAAAKTSGDEGLRRSVRLLICWIIPFWVVLEIMPTKLFNYPLPLYPAMSILCAGAFFALNDPALFQRSRRISAVLYVIAGSILVAVVVGFDSMFSEKPSLLFWTFPVFVALVFLAAIFMWRGQGSRAAITALITTAILTPLTYQYIFPRLSDLRLSDRLHVSIAENTVTPNRIITPTHTEPSVVYRLGTKTLMGEQAEATIKNGLIPGDILIIDRLEPAPQHGVLNLNAKVYEPNHCLREKDRVSGNKYSNFQDVDLIIYQVENCS